MEYCYSISKFKTFESNQVPKIFPGNFQLNIENDKIFLIVKTEGVLDSEVFIEVQRECDRIFFLTGEQLNPQFQWKKDGDGITHCQQNIRCDLRTVKRIPENITKQQWDLSLAVQLRLWQLANLPDLPINVKINLLFQIIEIAFPDRTEQSNYPKYTDLNKDPDSKTESFLLRDLVSHGIEVKIKNDDLKKYCNFLKVKETFYDPVDINFKKAVEGRFRIVEQEARRVISERISFAKI